MSSNSRLIPYIATLALSVLPACVTSSLTIVSRDGRTSNSGQTCSAGSDDDDTGNLNGCVPCGSDSNCPSGNSICCECKKKN